MWLAQLNLMAKRSLTGDACEAYRIALRLRAALQKCDFEGRLLIRFQKVPFAMRSAEGPFAQGRRWPSPGG